MPARIRRPWSTAFLCVLGSSALYVFILSWTVPDVSSLVDQTPERTSYMRVMAGELNKAEDTFRVEPAEVFPPNPMLACAIIKSEDLAFFRHEGVNWGQLLSRITTRFTLSGASTITQQLARNVFLEPEQSLGRKIRELFIARELERKLSKRRILELYLNVIEWGEGTWGAGPAARRYFGKSPAELDAFEATFLSALTAAPRHPLTGPNLDRAESVQHRVLIQLYRSGILDEKTWREADTRASAVFGCLRQGQALSAAFTCTEAPPPTGTPQPFYARTQVEPLRDWLEHGCGMERESTESRAIRELRRQEREQGK
ncbi:MAG TPA: biosynthetic peptidoglycan transglycosylase [Archangium sp.]|nr:biosynthetic peptidoglycan transglycosylase [Archangium sp.]